LACSPALQAVISKRIPLCSAVIDRITMRFTPLVSL
jgi:hypothetical protein